MSDGLIRVMPDALANKIAAGEVVQRPASALKEMLENSLDAGASAVEVVVRKAGSELIQVIDDGSGMSAADAHACFLRHATSKIRSIEDLERLRTLGFRGEALASIAAVAQIELKTRRVEDAAGVRLRLDGGTLTDEAPCAMTPGTSLAVRNLFFNVPARRTFLKTPATELKHLLDTFTAVALSHPEVAFRFEHDGNELFRLSGSAAPFSEALAARVAALVGDRAEGALVPVAEQTSYLSVRGVVGRPESARRSRGEQHLFVNGRTVRHRGLEHAVSSAFEGVLGKDEHPLFALFLDLDPRHVDVNVHPSKTEVKFDDERGVYSFLRAVVKKGLGDADLTPRAAPAPALASDGASAFSPPGLRFADFGAEPDAPAPQPRRVTFEAGSSRGPSGPIDPPIDSGASAGGPSRPATPARRSEDEAPAEAGMMFVPATEPPEDAELRLDTAPPVWPLHGRYLVSPIRSGLLVVDQRAAHERILYEQALAVLEGGFAPSQQLLFPVVIELSPADHALLDELMPDLRSLGFQIEPFGGRTVKLSGLPEDIRPGREQHILPEVLEQFRHYRDGLNLTGRDNLARSFARRRAVRPDQVLSEPEARGLIEQLFLCETPYADPLGRPTMVKISMEELARRFAR